MALREKKTAAQRAPKQVLAKLREARGYAKMERASFGFQSDVVEFKGKKYTLDEFLKEQTSPYRASWLVPLLDDLIAWAEGKELTKHYKRVIR